MILRGVVLRVCCPWGALSLRGVVLRGVLFLGHVHLPPN